MQEEKSEEVNQEERDKLLYELVVRQSALEMELIKAGVITEKGLAESQLICMVKVQAIIARHLEEKEQDKRLANIDDEQESVPFRFEMVSPSGFGDSGQD